MTVVLAAEETGALARAAAALAEGAVVGVPTDTVYGLVCLCSDAAAVDRLFAVKGRPAAKALPVLLGDDQQAEEVVEGALPPAARLLMERYWPGPLTLVLPAQPHLPSALTAGRETVGVRLPAQSFLRALARGAGPLASSSANRSGAPPCTTAAAVLEQLEGRIPLLIDAGPTRLAQPSAVLDLCAPQPELLRPGPLGQEALAAVRAVQETGECGTARQRGCPRA